MIQRINTTRRLSQAVISNGHAYLSGQTATNPLADFATQTQQVLDKIDALLKEVGSNREKLISASVWLPNISHFNEFNAIWDNWVPEGYAPARACVESKLANPDLLVEVAIIAEI